MNKLMWFHVMWLLEHALSLETRNFMGNLMFQLVAYFDVVCIKLYSLLNLYTSEWPYSLINRCKSVSLFPTRVDVDRWSAGCIQCSFPRELPKAWYYLDVNSIFKYKQKLINFSSFHILPSLHVHPLDLLRQCSFSLLWTSSSSHSPSLSMLLPLL